MGRKRADFWRYAERMGNRFKCKFCKQVFPGGVVRLRSHLSGITGQGIQVCSKVPEDVKSAARLASNGMKKSKLETASSNSDNTSSEINDARCSDEVESSLAKFFELNDIDCSIVESPSFINLVNVLIKSGSGYVLPSCSTLENQLIPSLRKEVDQYVSIARQSWEETGCTLVFDIWRSEKEKRSFICIMACSGKRAVLLNTFEIPNNNLTASFLEEVVHFVVEYVGADKVVQYFVDDNQCSEEIAKLLTSKCPHAFKTRCVVREIESFFEEVHQEVDWIRATFGTAKYLVDAMYKDGDLLALMRKYTGGKELKQSPGYDMLESIFEVREDLVKFAQSPDWLASGYDLQENGKKATAIITSEEFWKQGEEVIMALKPLFTILHLDDTSDSSFGYLYGLVKVAEEVIAHLQTNKQEKYQKLWSIFELKKNRIIHETHKAAAFLNPAYLCNATDQDITQMEEGINYIIQKFVAVSDREAFVEQAMHYRQTLSDPHELFKTIAAKTSTPCEWWNGFGKKFPILKKHATKILCQPCGSSSYKGGLGAFRANLVKQRGLVPELNDLNVRMNLFLMEKCNADNEEKKKRINFEEFAQQKSTNGSSDAALVEPRHSDDETRLSTTRGELPGPKPLKFCFMTVVASPILTDQKVKGYQGCPIHVYLADSATDCAVQDGAPSTLTLSISVLDGDFTNESSTDECRTREYFDRNDLSSDLMPLVTGDLQLTLVQGVGLLGEFSFNYSSRGTRSGKFRLAVKTFTGDCEGIRILEGISNAFVVEDNEVTRTQHPAALEMHLPKDSASLGGIALMEGWWGPIEQMLGESSSSPGDWNGSIWNYNHLQRSCRSLTQRAARRVKKKALLWRSRSCNLQIKKKMSRSPEPLDKETTVGAEFQCPAQLQTLLRSLIIRNNVNQQEDGENGKLKAVLEGIDLFNTNSIESPTVTPFGVVGLTTSGTESRPTGDTSEVQSPKCLSTALQLSLAEDEVPKPVEALHSNSGGKTVNHEKDQEPPGNGGTMKMGSLDQSLDKEKIGDELLELREVSSSICSPSVDRKDIGEAMATVKGFDFLKKHHLPEASSVVAGGSVIPKWPECPGTAFGFQVGSSEDLIKEPKENISAVAYKSPKIVELNESDKGKDITEQNNAISIAKPKYRHEFYQNPEEVVVTIFAKRVPANSVTVDFGEQILSVSIEVPGEDAYHFQSRLFGKIIPEKCKFEVLSTKVEIRLAKAHSSIQWETLEYSKEAYFAPPKANVSSVGSGRPMYPYSENKAVTWDELEAEVKEEKEEKLYGDAGLNKLFQDIFKNADEDMRRAMIKSFQESQRTVVSTNWKELGAKKTDATPPDGTELKK